MGQVLRLLHRLDGAGHVVDLRLEGPHRPRDAQARFVFGLTAQDREDIRWYLEDYLEYPAERAPQIARRVEERLAELGRELFTVVFQANRDARALWAAVAGSLADTRVEVATGAEGAAAVPWELLRDPASDGVLALRAGAFVRIEPQADWRGPGPDGTAGALRVLLVICRPGGQEDVPFRSIAGQLLDLARSQRRTLQLDVLRPPTFAQLTRELTAAKAAGSPYHVVHFDGHGTYLDVGAAAAGAESGPVQPAVFSLVSPPRPGAHGFLVFEDPGSGGNWQLVDGPALGRLLADAGVPVLVLNACRSAHADLVTAPETVTAEADAHRRVRAYGSLAQEVMNAGVPGVVAMRYNVFVETALRFILDVYGGLLAGHALGEAVAAARRQLAADPVRQVGAALPLQDWMVPVVYEAAPLVLRAPAAGPGLAIDLEIPPAGLDRARLGTGLPPGPDVGFIGRDETLLTLDRAFDAGPVVLLHSWAGAGKTATALEFARWYELTGAARAVLFTSFQHHLPLARLLGQVGEQFRPALEEAGVQWAELDEARQRDVAMQVLAQVPALWVWDDVEAVAGFPAGAPSAWNAAEQGELAGFLRDLAAKTRCKVLLASRRDERGWLGDMPRRAGLPPMPMLERLELARAVAARQPGGGDHSMEVLDWRPLLRFTQGNPLTVAVLVRQVLRDHLSSPGQMEEFVAGLRAGSARITDDAAQGRGASLTASLDYGCTGAFTGAELPLVALLALFQGFLNAEALRLMGDSDVAGLLGRAAEAGLLTARGGGYYEVHPAAPWYLDGLFQQHHGAPGSATAAAAVRAWTAAIAELGDQYAGRYETGDADVIGVLGAEEANLARALQLARDNGWPDLLIGPMQGLRILYGRDDRLGRLGRPGRDAEWRRLVDAVIPYLTDPVTGGPRPGLGRQWVRLTEYRVVLARRDRDGRGAQRLQEAVVAWRGEQAARVLAAAPDSLDEQQRSQIRELAIAFWRLGDVQLERDQAGSARSYSAAADLFRRIGARREEATAALRLGNAYQRDRNLPDAAAAYQQALELLPEHAAGDLATAHNALGDIYGAAGETDRALGHYRESIQQEERRGNRYGVGRARYNAASTLLGAGRRGDALRYARAALDDHQAAGPDAAAEADRARQLVDYIEQQEVTGQFGAVRGIPDAPPAPAQAAPPAPAQAAPPTQAAPPAAAAPVPALPAAAGPEPEALRGLAVPGYPAVPPPPAAPEPEALRGLAVPAHPAVPLPPALPEPAAARAVNTIVALPGTAEPVAADRALAVDSAYDLLVNIGRHVAGSLLSRADAVWPDELLPDQGVWLRAALTLDNAPQPLVRPFFLPREGESFACDCPPDAGHQPGCDRRPWTRFPVRTPARPGLLRGELVIYYEVTAVHAQVLTLPVGTAAPGGPPGPRAELLGRLSRTFSNLRDLADRTASVVVSPSRVVVNGIQFADNPFAIPAAAADTAALNTRQMLYNSHFLVDAKGGERSRYGPGYTKAAAEFESDLRSLAKAGAELYVRLFDVPAAGNTVSFSLPDLLREEAQRRHRPPVLQIVDPAYDQHAILWAAVYDLPLGGDPARYELCPSVREFGPGGAGQAAAAPVRCQHEDEHRGRGNVLCPWGFWGLSCIIEQPPDAGRDLESIVTTGAEPLRFLLAADSKLDRRLTEAHVSQLQARLPAGAVARAPVATETELASALGPESMDVVYFYCHSGYEAQSRGAAGHYLNFGDYYIEPIDVNMWARSAVWPRPHWGSRHPLVVLNGCHTTEVTSGTVNSFVPAFTRWAAASGVLGTEVTMEQGLAGWVAEQALAALAAGNSVGEAIRATRWTMFGLGNVMGFAYTPYCLANLSLRAASPG